MSEPSIPQPPRRPPPLPDGPSEVPSRRKSVWSIVLAVMFGLVLLAGLAFLAAPFGPVILVVGVGLLVLLAVTFTHYIFWGYWIGDSIRREVEEEEERKKQQKL
jgi:uncharacterized oligopeptide transporter (OPT) family protein